MSASVGVGDKRSRVLVTGATGLVGNNVARLLLQRRGNVRVLVRNQSDSRALEGLDLEIATGDITDPASLAAAMRESQPSSIRQAAYCWGGRTSTSRIDQSPGGSQRGPGGAPAGARMVYVSTINTLGVGTKDQPADEEHAAAQNIPCPYVVSKQAGEAAVRQEIEAGLDAVIVHPGLMFGPWDWKPSSGRMILEVARNFTPMAPAGGCSTCDVRTSPQAFSRHLTGPPRRPMCWAATT